MKVAVVGHVEWIDFVRVEHVPRPGEIAHAEEAWADPGGGGSVAAVQLARLAGSGAFYTALGGDHAGRRSRERLEELGVTVLAARRPGAPTRRAVTFVDDAGERTITTIGERLRPDAADPLPWDDLEGVDAVYVCATDEAGLRAARRARVLVATPRVGPALLGAGVRLDALVGSGRDPGERYEPGSIRPSPSLVVQTMGMEGGTWQSADGGGRFEAEPAPTPDTGVMPDAYGCGDSFAAGLTFAVGAGMDVHAALALAARCGAICASGRGPYGRQLTAADL